MPVDYVSAGIISTCFGSAHSERAGFPKRLGERMRFLRRA